MSASPQEGDCFSRVRKNKFSFKAVPKEGMPRWGKTKEGIYWPLKYPHQICSLLSQASRNFSLCKFSILSIRKYASYYACWTLSSQITSGAKIYRVREASPLSTCSELLVQSTCEIQLTLEEKCCLFLHKVSSLPFSEDHELGNMNFTIHPVSVLTLTR